VRLVAIGIAPANAELAIPFAAMQSPAAGAADEPYVANALTRFLATG
jgi:hypothetical protein